MRVVWRTLLALVLAGGLAAVAWSLLARHRVQTPVRLEVDQATGVVHLTRGQTDLPGLQMALQRGADGSILRRQGEAWLLTGTLVIDTGASLELSGATLRLNSTPDQEVGLEARGGDLTIVDSMVTSWDPSRGTADGDVRDGRAWVLARDGSSMIVRDSTMRMLGYDAYERYGVSWRTAGTGGSVDGSTFAGNYYGLYTFGAEPMRITDSVIKDSLSYGLDLHTGSDGFLIQGDRFLHNGKHGFILAVDCTNAVVKDNLAVGNAQHGFVVFQGSDHATLEGNDAHGNGGSGIDVSGSKDVRVRGNAVYENRNGIVIHDRSSDIAVEGNRVAGNGSDGVVLSSGASSVTLTGNLVDFNRRSGLYLDDGTVRVQGDNRILDNTVGVWVSGGMEEATITGNRIGGSTDDGVHVTDLTPAPVIRGNRITESGKAAFSGSSKAQVERFVAENTLRDNDAAMRVRGPS
ncbi:MAG TPA: right-handed parallel beta-helix repeat-containing protein [Actinomycetota bacterium]|jgi:parallel beta-helix repeat protein|nr:right-handed parallel beta-helix repeat-containing protein [Actinomycetota bacterium]